MKKLLILILVFMPLLAVSQLRPHCGHRVELKDCTARKPTSSDLYPLMGRVRVVKSDKEKADFNIFVTKSRADMIVFVKKDEKTAFGCGIWQWVNRDENFSVRFVDSPDDAHFSVRFVESQSEWYGCSACED